MMIIEPIKKIDDELKLVLPRIDDAGKLLAADIGRLTAGVTIHNRINDDIENVIVSLVGISSKVRPVKTESRRRDELLTDLSKRYTMESERETHLKTEKITMAETDFQTATAVGVMTEEAAAGEGQPPDKKDDLGDNVDLF